MYQCVGSGSWLGKLLVVYQGAFHDCKVIVQAATIRPAEGKSFLWVLLRPLEVRHLGRASFVTQESYSKGLGRTIKVYYIHT